MPAHGGGLCSYRPHPAFGVRSTTRGERVLQSTGRRLSRRATPPATGTARRPAGAARPARPLGKRAISRQRVHGRQPRARPESPPGKASPLLRPFAGTAVFLAVHDGHGPESEPSGGGGRVRRRFLSSPGGYSAVGPEKVFPRRIPDRVHRRCHSLGAGQRSSDGAHPGGGLGGGSVLRAGHGFPGSNGDLAGDSHARKSGPMARGGRTIPRAFPRRPTLAAPGHRDAPRPLPAGRYCAASKDLSGGLGPAAGGDRGSAAPSLQPASLRLPVGVRAKPPARRGSPGSRALQRRSPRVQP